jgi:hypothetical protein
MRKERGTAASFPLRASVLEVVRTTARPQILAGLRQAIDRARTRHQQVRTSDNRGFYHGLITGYAVAMKVLVLGQKTPDVS